MLYRIIIVLIMFVVTTNVQSQEKTNNPVIISGNIWPIPDDTIILIHYPYKLGTSQAGGITSKYKTSNGYFRFELNSYDQASYCTIRSKKIGTLILEDLLIEKNDSIHITAVTVKPERRVKPFFRITGKNAAKNQLQHEWLYNGDFRKQRSDAGLLASTTNLGDALIVAEKHSNALKAEWDSLTQTLSDTISLHSRNIFLRDFSVNKLRSLLARFNFFFEEYCYKQAPKDSITELTTDYKRIFLPEFNQLLDQFKLTHYSPMFLDLVIKKILTDERIQTGTLGKIPAENYVKWLYDYPDFCKQEAATTLAAYTITYGLKSDKLGEILNQIAALVNKKNLREVITKYQINHAKGATVFPFVLTNAKGGKTDIRELKDKVVVVDFWFTGCTPCIGMAKIIRQLKKEIGPHNDIVYMSISIDKNPQTWLKSVETELYTEKENINLYTDGLENTHPLIQYYSFSGYPKLMIIGKNNRLVSSTPPVPNNSNDFGKLKEMILNAAAE